MRAGRDLDTILVEKLMGWRYDPARTFSPSTNITQAFDVWAMLNEHGIEVRLSQVWEGGKVTGWRCECQRSGADEVLTATEATASHAICLGALRSCAQLAAAA